MKEASYCYFLWIWVQNLWSRRRRTQTWLGIYYNFISIFMINGMTSHMRDIRTYSCGSMFSEHPVQIMPQIWGSLIASCMPCPTKLNPVQCFHTLFNDSISSVDIIKYSVTCEGKYWPRIWKDGKANMALQFKRNDFIHHLEGLSKTLINLCLDSLFSGHIKFH
jgi:hypothetical protein